MVGNYYLSLLLAIIAVQLLTIFVASELVMEGEKGQTNYLKEFGYMEVKGLGPDKKDTFVHAVKKFQQMWGLKVSGKVDHNTKSLMHLPRCGNLDILSTTQKDPDKSRPKRFAILPFGGWKKNALTYRVLNRPDTLNVTQVLHAISKAFKQWSKVSSLTFTRVLTNPDINILFVSYKHGDGTFDGRGGIVAHTYFPVFGGDLHFDASEYWTLGTGKGTDLFHTAVHEIGHALGLSHTRDKKAVMYPYYKYQRVVQLGEDDIKGIQFLYGDHKLYRPMSMPYTHSCDKIIDAATTNQNGDIMMFTGKYFILANGRGAYPGYPRLINDVFPDIPNYINAVLHLPAITQCMHGKKFKTKSTIDDESLYFFKGEYYYLYDSNYKFKGRGKISSTFSGVPSAFDSTFSRDGKHIYFVKGNNYWRMSRKLTFKLDKGYPHKLSDDFIGLPDRIDAAFTTIKHTKNMRKVRYSFFFRGNKFYRITGWKFQVDKSRFPFPRTIGSKWFKCKR